MPRQKPVPCGLCGHQFPRDPVLEVACPECEAPIGVQCASVAPSGHRKSTGFSKLPPWGHDARDLLAAKHGHYCHPCTEEAPCEGCRPGGHHGEHGDLPLFGGAA